MKKRVQFSEVSTLAVYEEDPIYTTSKSFTASERKCFQVQAAREAYHVRLMLSQAKKSSSKSLEDQLKSCGIDKEAILGIEHLVLESSPFDIVRRRQAHVRSILIEQAYKKINVKSDGQVSNVMTTERSSLSRGVQGQGGAAKAA